MKDLCIMRMAFLDDNRKPQANIVATFRVVGNDYLIPGDSLCHVSPYESNRTFVCFASVATVLCRR